MMIGHLLAANQSLMVTKNSSMVSFVQEGWFEMPVFCTPIAIGIGVLSSSTSWLFLRAFCGGKEEPPVSLLIPYVCRKSMSNMAKSSATLASQQPHSPACPSPNVEDLLSRPIPMLPLQQRCHS